MHSMAPIEHLIYEVMKQKYQYITAQHKTLHAPAGHFSISMLRRVASMDGTSTEVDVQKGSSALKREESVHKIRTHFGVGGGGRKGAAMTATVFHSFIKRKYAIKLIIFFVIFCCCCCCFAFLLGTAFSCFVLSLVSWSVGRSVYSFITSFHST